MSLDRREPRLERDDGPMARPPKTHVKNPDNSFSRFESAVKRMLAVPKEEIDKREAGISEPKERKTNPCSLAWLATAKRRG